MELKGTPNCGVAYLDGVQRGGVKDRLYEMLYENATDNNDTGEDGGRGVLDFPLDTTDGDDFEGGIIIFTTGKREARGEHADGKTLRTLIEENDLGSVAVLTPVKNPNTGNFITLYAWAVNREGVQKWYADEYARRNPAPKIVVKPSPTIKFNK